MTEQKQASAPQVKYSKLPPVVKTLPPEGADIGTADVGVATADAGAMAGPGGDANGRAGFAPQVFDPAGEMPNFETELEWEAFMLDKLRVETFYPTAPSCVDLVSVNFQARDRAQNVFFGMVQDLPRWCVELMARCRDASVKAPIKRLEHTGDDIVFLNKTEYRANALLYPYRVLHDPRGQMGLSWERAIRRQRV